MMSLRVGVVDDLPSDSKRDRKERRLVPMVSGFLLSFGKHLTIFIPVTPPHYYHYVDCCIPPLLHLVSPLLAKPNKPKDITVPRLDCGDGTRHAELEEVVRYW